MYWMICIYIGVLGFWGFGVLGVVGQNTSDLTFYWATASQLFVINADPGITFSGDWVQETVPSGSSAFNQRSFNSNVAAYSSGLGSSGASGDVSISTEAAEWRQFRHGAALS